MSDLTPSMPPGVSPEDMLLLSVEFAETRRQWIWRRLRRKPFPLVPKGWTLVKSRRGRAVWAGRRNKP